jgi:type I restriction enzyme S subunit
MSSKEWELYKLGDLCQITSSKRIFSDEYVDSGIPFYRSKEIIQKSLGEEITEYLFIPKQRFNEIKSKFGAPHHGDILLSSVGNRSGIPYFVRGSDGDFYFKDGNLTWFRDFDEKLNSKYLLYWLRSSLGQELLNSIMIGSAQKALTIIELSNLPINVPSIETQRRIADILSSLDDKIELNHQTSATLEAIAQAVFEEWFVNFNFFGTTGEMIESNLGMIPKGWTVGKVGDVADLKGGTTPSTKEEIYWNGDYYFATPKDLSTLSSPILLDTERKITKEGVSQISSGILPAGTLLLSSRAPIGYLAISDIPVSINQGFIAINAKKTSNLFILFWLKENMETVISRANGSTFLEISKTNFKEIELVVPEAQTASRFDEIINPIFEKIKNNEQEATALVSLRDTLLLKLVSGEIEV